MSEKRSTVLIVDEEAINTSLLSRILEPTVQTHQVHSGTDAIVAIAEQDIDLVLLDLMMPGMNGFEVLEQIRAEFDPDELPVIIVSALMETKDVVKGLNAQANDYIIKPFRPELVRARVETHLRLKRSSDERRHFIHQLEQANRIRNYLLRIASHDLKSPLHNVQMAFELLSEDEMSEERAEILRIGQAGVRTMLETIGGYLDLGLLREERIQVTLSATSLSEAVDRSLLHYRLAASERNVTFDLNLEDIQVLADSRHIEHVLSNIISNALKYSPDNESVRIEASKDQSEGHVTVHIIDRGEGIPADEQKNLFEPFASISTKPTNGESSTGIGLWIASEMMSLQNGEIGFDTPDEGGSDFWIRLPLVDATHEDDNSSMSVGA